MNRQRASVDLTRSFSALDFNTGTQPAHAKRSSVALPANKFTATSPVLGYHQEYQSQEKTFRRWLNSKLESASLPTMDRNLAVDLSDGVKLCQLIEIMSGTSLGRYNKRPVMRVQKAENVTLALNYLKSKVLLTNVGAEDIIDGNLKIILGLIWTLILRFTMTDIAAAEEGQGSGSAKEGLLMWCQRMLVNYQPQVDIRDFSKSWRDGLAFCALIHRHRPDIIDYDTCLQADAFTRIKTAFEAAETHLKLPQILDVADIMDERSTMTYVAELLLAFSDAEKAKSATKQVVAFTEVIQSLSASQEEYEARAKLLSESVQTMIKSWQMPLPTTYAGLSLLLEEFQQFERTNKREWSIELFQLSTLLFQINGRLQSHSMNLYRPAQELSPEGLHDLWLQLCKVEKNQHKLLMDAIDAVREALQERFSRLAYAIVEVLLDLQSRFVAIHSHADESHLSQLIADLRKLEPSLVALESIDRECRQAHITQNKHCTYSLEDIEHQVQSLSNALSVHQTAIRGRLSQAKSIYPSKKQLQNLETVFNHYSADASNRLDLQNFAGALEALGSVYTHQEVEDMHAKVSDDEGFVSRAQFVQLMTHVHDNHNSKEDMRDALAALGGSKGYLTLADLEKSALPPSSKRFLMRKLQASKEQDQEEALDYESWISALYNN